MDADRNYKAEIDSAFTLIKELTSRLLKEDAPSTIASSISSTASRKRAKAEAARAKLEFAKRAAELRKKQALLDQEIAIEAARTSKQKADLEAELDLLTHKKELAAAEAETEALESEQLNSQSVQSRILPNLPTEDAIGRTATYVNCHVQPALQPALVENYQDPDPVLNPKAPVFTPDWTSLVLRKKLLLSRISSFSDRPEMYAAWKATFRCIVNELSLSPMEELDLMIKWLGPDSRRQAMSIKTSNARDPQKGLQRIWERPEERYGPPEVVETSLKQKLAAFPKLTSRDTKKLYELAAILSEVESVKEDQQYSLLLSYFDTSAGVKLPVGLQEKWTTHAVKYNKRHSVHFPPFSEFMQFVRDAAKIRNNPSFMYDPPTQYPTSKKDRTMPVREHVSAHKTGISDKHSSLPKDTVETRCPIHNMRHPLIDCRSFRSKPISERRRVLKKNGRCFRCCTPGHMQEDCKATVRSDCGSDNHPTALHVDGEECRDKVTSCTNSKDEPVNSKCTHICGNGVSSRSCAKILLVRVFSEEEPAKALMAYAIIDDQSN